MVEHDVTGVVFPFDVSEELITRSRVRFSYRVDVEGTDDPAEKPDKSNYVREGGKKEDPQVLGNVLSSCLVDCDTKLDSSAAAADAKEE